MSKQAAFGIAVAIAALASADRAAAELTVYTNETDYLTALAAQGYVPVQEGFEDDAPRSS